MHFRTIVLLLDYREINMRYTKCLFCEEPKVRGDFLCRYCRTLYNPYKAEVWFTEFIILEQRQRRISRTESTNFEVDRLSLQKSTFFGSSKPRGRPKTTSLIESYIYSIYHESMSVRVLTRMCVSAGLTVSRESVRTIVNKLKLTKK